ncbi:MAG: hypothetical protein JSY10_17815 [Paenibacillus sp.]|uniref:F-box domain-containing protein n=1 Tax=Thamnidium elegans TaxID=101142 RepID=A0A8H7VVD6_9FUNG|nr:hypothetical protein INT48_008199 [Thamnidium elegans]MBM6385817.1 hypothetical protein [Paenibacillus sp.]
MEIWKYLSHDILDIVFQYLEFDTMVSSCPDERTYVHLYDIYQCQLTCKNWASLAQIYIYKRVLLNDNRDAEIFLRSIQDNGLGYLVKHIHLPENLGRTETSRESALAYIHYIAVFCPFLKTLNMDATDFRDVCVWKAIRDERLGGNFTRLQVMPLVEEETENTILYYNDAIYSLQQTLRELVFYNKNLSLDESKLRGFPNMDLVMFKFDGFSDMHFVCEKMKWFPSATNIEMFVGNYVSNQDQIGFPVHVFPQVEKFLIDEHYYRAGISSYIMNAFPNLQELNIAARNTYPGQLVLPTKVAVPFLEYLVGVSEFYVYYIPIADQHSAMLGFYGKKRRISKLKIGYLCIPSCHPHFISLNTDPKVKELIEIQVGYRLILPPLLPEIGLIEQSGENIEFLELDMGIHSFDMISAALRSKQGVCLSRILQRCPHLRGISIWNTCFNLFGRDLILHGRIKISDHLSFNNSLINTMFLQNMSSSVYFISEFTLNNCRFNDNTLTEFSRVINMPDTEFRTITYEERLQKEKIYLQLTKTQTRSTNWHRIEDGGTFICTKQEYENSLITQNTLSLTVCCKNIFEVNIILLGGRGTIYPL